MTSIAEPKVEVRYQGGSAGGELWGMTQGDFILSMAGLNQREVAVLLNDPAAQLLATELGRDDTPQFRQEAVHQVGQFWLEQLEQKGAVDPQIFVSVGLLNEHPEIIEHLKRRHAQ